MTTFAGARALVVGIDDYAAPDLRLPVTVRHDAEDVAALLRDPARCGYAPGAVTLLAGRAATREAVLAALDDLTANTADDGTAFLYFSGHGWRLPDGDYLLPADADVSAPERVAASGIPAAEFSRRVNAVPAGRLLAVLDCCHAAGVAALKGAPAAKAGLSGSTYAALEAGRGRVILAACAPEEQAVVLQRTDRNSLFTAHLLDGLRGKAATDDDRVKVFGLFEYVQLQVTGRYPGQNPVFKADLKNNFAVALKNDPLVKGVVARGPQAVYQYDAFVAHADPDFDWVLGTLAPALDGNGLRYTVSAEFLAKYRVTAVEDAITQSKYVLLVLSPNYTHDRLTRLAGTLGQDFGLKTGKYRVIPVKIGEPAAEVGLSIGALVGVDLTRTGRRYEFELTKLLKHLHTEPRDW